MFKFANVNSPETLDIPTASTGFLRYLQDQGLLDASSVQRVGAAISSSGHAIDTVLLELGLVPESKLADAEATFLGFERASLSDFPEELPSDAVIPHDFLKAAGVLPLEIEGETFSIAVSRPFELDAARGLGHFLGKVPVIKIATATEISQHLQRLFDAGNHAPEQDGSFGFGAAIEDDVERLKDVAREAPVIKLLNRIVTTAITQNASDIHIEPHEDHVQVRFRVDGALHVAERLAKDMQAGLISRVKILAKLNIAEQRLPQDGRIKLPVRGRDIEFRVSTTPLVYGESVALRILDRQQLPLNFQALGYRPVDTARLQRLSAHPNGIVLVTGPTGSGKTTTLYAALNALNKPEVKVFTVEDPVEYRLKGINQINVKPAIGLDFAAVLRSILRQDPDIIMIGEIRDSETAKIAVQASLTGHLVLSTLHTNSAVASITRLLDMGIEDYLLASTLRGIVAQRLLRKLCTKCRVPVLKEAKPFQDWGFPVGSKIYQSAGCQHCNGTGYQGRTVAYEILEFSDTLRAGIVKKNSEAELAALAHGSGMVTLHQSAIGLVADGETSLEEVHRVTQGADAT